MASREELIKQAEAKFQREQLVKAAQDKWLNESQASVKTDSSIDPNAALIGLQEGTSFGLRPMIAGLGAAAGSAYGEAEKGIKSNEGLMDYVSRIGKSVPSAFKSGRLEALSEQEKAARESPGSYLAGNVASGLLTAKFLPVTSIGSAAKVGALQGTGRAISEQQSLPEAAKTIGTSGGLGVLSYGAAKGIEKAAPVVREGISKVSSFLGDKTKKAFIKTAYALTGETEKNIKNFIEKNDAVEKIIKESGGNIGVAADNVRQTLQNQIQSFRRSQNAAISDALDNVSPDKAISKDTIIGALNRIKSRININLKPEEAGQIDELITRINNVAGKSDRLSLKELYDVQDFLYERAKGAYMKDGQIFVPGKVSQQAAKSGAREAKIILDDAVPELRSANEALSKLHKIEENINKNLIAPGKSEAALLAAGGATSGRNRIYLDQLGKIIGKDVIGEAEKLSSAAAFASPQLMPKSAGGTTSTTRTIAGGILGTMLGGVPGGVAGTAIAGAITSPAALKQAIKGGLLSQKVLEQTFGRAINFADDKVMNNLIKFLQTPQGLTALNNAATSGKSAIQRRMDQLNKQGGQ